MKLPHNRYILTLIAGKMSNQEILVDLKQYSLPAPKAQEVNDLRDQLKLGQLDYFAGKESVDLNWLRDLGIEAMFGFKFNKQVVESIDGIEGAFKVLNDPNMYKTITSLAMSGVTPEDIELIVNGKYDVEYSSNDLDKFLHYFFDISKWSRYNKESYIAQVSDKQLTYFYKMALDEEKDFLMWKLGVAPNKSFDAMLRDMTVDSYYNFKEQATRNPDQAQKWGQLMLKVQERLEKVEKDLNADSDATTDLASLFEKAVNKKIKHVQVSEKEEGDTSEDNMPNILKEASPLGKEVPRIIRPEDLN